MRTSSYGLRVTHKILLKDKKGNKQLVCFSTETFVRIKEEKVYYYPMKATNDAYTPDARQVLMDDEKEATEHATIVDLKCDVIQSQSPNL